MRGGGLTSCVMLGAALAALACVCEVRAQPAPARIVSLDLCTDQLLVELVDRSRIAAVTHLLGDVSVSAIPEKARGLRITHGGAEDVLRTDPDLVLAGPYGVSATVSPKTLPVTDTPTVHAPALVPSAIPTSVSSTLTLSHGG